MRDGLFTNAVRQEVYDLRYLFAEARYDRVSADRWSDDGGAVYEPVKRLTWTGEMHISNASLDAVLHG